MDYFINLLRPNKRSKFRIISGIVLLVLGLIFGYGGIIGEYTIYQWVLFGLYMFAGIFYLLNGLGVGLKTYAYIWITDDAVYSRLGKRELEEKANWDEIKSISFKLNKFIIERKDDTYFEMYSPMGNLSFEKIQEIKTIFEEMANKHHFSFVID